MKALVVRTTSRTYPIRFTGGKVGDVLRAVKEEGAGRQTAWVVDSNVHRLYGSELKKTLAKSGDLVLIVPAGEASKSRARKEKLEDALLRARFGGRSRLVALGGGVVGDLTGFTASTYYRGIDFVQVPTTLLAMVDSSVGGKTAVDTPHGKNLVGSYWQPSSVRVETSFLDTLPEDQFRSGLAEVLKAGFIADEGLVSFLESRSAAILARDPAALARVIRDSLVVKAKVVGVDERETGGLRRILNFGHTVGHAVEHLSRFRLAHGFCVSIGMAVEALLAERLGLLRPADSKRIIDLLATYGLPVSVPHRLAPKDVWKVMGLDKKNAEGRVRLALPRAIGSMHPGEKKSHVLPVEEAAVLSALAALRA